MYSGVFSLPWWGYIVVALVFTHITIAGVTIYLHRHSAHRALDLHAIPSHFFRLWLWLTTGMVTKEWVAIHRKHHAKVETEEDPHSPQFKGIGNVFWRGVELYREARNDRASIEQYGKGCPDDWIERKLYTPHATLGPTLLLFISFALFGFMGVAVWAVLKYFKSGVSLTQIWCTYGAPALAQSEELLSCYMLTVL
jgi:stearoyl-CoA desaturase (delta-9 desaturase)